MLTRYYVGLDLGQTKDYTALAVVERVLPDEHDGTLEPEAMPEAKPVGDEAKPMLHLVHLERFALGTPYPDIVASVKALMARPEIQDQAELVADATGVGRPVVDMLRAAGVRPLTSVSIHGGDSVTEEKREVRLPKRDLVATLQVLLQEGRMRMAEGLAGLDLLKAELQAFKAQINLKTGHDTYEAWRERDHDDLVLALALACWRAERPRPPAVVIFGTVG